MKETKCEYCGKTIREDEVQTFQGVTMCKDCLEEKTVICTWCNNRIWNEDNYGNGSVDLCQTCYDKIEYSPISENIKRPSEPLSNVACLVTSGYVSDVIGNMVYIGYEDSNNHDCTFNFNLGTVLIYDTENNKIEKGSVNDMISGKVSGGEGSLVLAQFNWMMPIVYVIYK